MCFLLYPSIHCLVLDANSSATKGKFYFSKWHAILFQFMSGFSEQATVTSYNWWTFWKQWVLWSSVGRLYCSAFLCQLLSSLKMKCMKVWPGITSANLGGLFVTILLSIDLSHSAAMFFARQASPTREFSASQALQKTKLFILLRLNMAAEWERSMPACYGWTRVRQCNYSKVSSLSSCDIRVTLEKIHPLVSASPYCS